MNKHELSNILLTKELEAIKLSLSWRVTAPLRAIVAKNRGVYIPFKNFVKRIIRGPAQPELTSELPILNAEKEAIRTILLKELTQTPLIDSIGGFQHKVSIIFPNKNTEPRFLQEAIESVLNQSYTNWELCIADNNSEKFNNKMLLKDLVGRLKDSRIKLRLGEVDEGIPGSSQRAFDLSTGDLIVFLDSDDILPRNAIENMVRFYVNNPGFDMIYSNHAMMDEDGNLLSIALKPDWSPEFFLSTNYIIHFKLLTRRIFEDVRGFTDTLNYAQDVGLTLKLMKAGARIGFCNEVCYYWRLHNKSVSSGTSAKLELTNFALDTLRDYIKWKNSNFDVIWPEKFSTINSGIYKIDFKKSILYEDVTVIILKSDLDPVHAIDLSSELVEMYHGVKTYIVDHVDDIPLLTTSKYAVVISDLMRNLSDGFLEELVGYLVFDVNIGAVGGKVLNDSLRVIAGSQVSNAENPNLCQGLFDAESGYWGLNQVASNSSAICLDFFATRSEHIFKYKFALNNCNIPALQSREFGSQISLASQRLVYNPNAFVICRDDSRYQYISDYEFSTKYYNPKLDGLGEFKVQNA
jgi:glycosyltransferase involved in cell wall biosynthesis